MAVVAQPPVNARLATWGTAESGAYPLESPDQMTSIMSYQYPPPPPPNGAEMELPPPGFMSNYSVPPQQQQPGVDLRQPQDPSMSMKERKDSITQANLQIKRSMSSPSGRPPQQPPPDHAMTLASEKRRNKLGYHRTSVACGHCRRRKIRCIPSPADPQGRCVNCIRLKKECSFYPVDQQPPTDPRQKAPSRASTGPKIPSASSSPAMQTGHPSDMPGQPHQYGPMSMPSIQTMGPPGMKPPGSEAFPPDNKMPTSASSSGRSFDYPGQQMGGWMPPDASPSSGGKPGDLNTTWRSYLHESPMTTPSYSPYTPQGPPSSATWTAPVSSESNSRDDMAWQSYPPPPRSMSFGGESMSSSHGQQYPPIPQASNRPFERKSMPSEMYPPPIATTIPSIDSVPGTTMDHSVSLSAGAVPPPNYGSWPHPPQQGQQGQSQPSSQQYPYPKSGGGDNYGSWTYGENGQSAPISSDEHGAPVSEGQPAPGMYYPAR